MARLPIVTMWHTQQHKRTMRQETLVVLSARSQFTEVKSSVSKGPHVSLLRVAIQARWEWYCQLRGCAWARKGQRREIEPNGIFSRNILILEFHAIPWTYQPYSDFDPLMVLCSGKYTWPSEVIKHHNRAHWGNSPTFKCNIWLVIVLCAATGMPT